MQEVNAVNQAHAMRLVAQAGRMLLEEGLAARTWGNVSCRMGINSMVITPSGMSYENMTEPDIVPFNMATGKWTGGGTPSSEKRIHTAAYRAFDQAGFVIHTHQTYASAIGLSGFHSLSLSDAQQLELGGLALCAYGLPGSEQLTSNVAAAFATGAHCVLMAHHGAVIAGRDRDEAFSRALLLESICRRACKGQDTQALHADSASAMRIEAAVKKAYGIAVVSSRLPLLSCAQSVRSIPAQLDDTAQMIGTRLWAVKPEESAVIRALRQHEVVLVQGVGAVCRVPDAHDCQALLQLAEKACVCYLHTRSIGDNCRLSLFDTIRMRVIYIRKYSKKIGGY